MLQGKADPSSLPKPKKPEPKEVSVTEQFAAILAMLAKRNEQQDKILMSIAEYMKLQKADAKPVVVEVPTPVGWKKITFDIIRGSDRLMIKVDATKVE